MRLGPSNAETIFLKPESPSTMPGHSEETHKQLIKIFGLASMTDLPAMSDHVRELISLLGNNQATAQHLAAAILKDYSLTTKVLQIVNSAFYAREVPISTISRAVTLIGYTTLRELATAIAIFEEFIKAGPERESLIELLTKNLVSATQSKILSRKKNYKVSAEEAFTCTLLHNLGKVLVLVYLPDLYGKVETNIEKGYSETRAAKMVLSGLTFADIGKEMGQYWNFSNKIVLCMENEPPRPRNSCDTETMLQNISAFNSQLTDVVCDGSEIDLEELIYKYGAVLSIGKEEAVGLVQESIEEAEDLSRPIRRGLGKMHLKEKLIVVEQDKGGKWKRVT